MTGTKIVILLLLSIWGIVILVCSPVALWAAANGSLSGTLKDPSGAVVPGATIILVNSAIKSEYAVILNGQGFYSFPTLPVGHYDMTIVANGVQDPEENELGGRY
jgi:Carboxypeptidase regulatory-like domain